MEGDIKVILRTWPKKELSSAAFFEVGLTNNSSRGFSHAYANSGHC